MLVTPLVMRPKASSSPVQFRRQLITVPPTTVPSTNLPSTSLPSLGSSTSSRPAPSRDINVLVINDGQEMAKEITLQLTLSFPGCAITYAPTLELARWILARRRINLIVSSPVLPDGGIGRLRDSLQRLQNPPDVVVVGDMALRSAELFGKSGYEFAAVRRLASKTEPSAVGHQVTPGALSKPAAVDTKIRSLGADLRNDLNNPLQEIVAMVFVAQATGALSESTGQALEAIDRAAKNMAQVVSKLEQKMLDVVR